MDIAARQGIVNLEITTNEDQGFFPTILPTVVWHSSLMSEENGYLAYLLRLRRVWRDGKPVWQAEVESPHSGEQRHFASLDDLFTYLREKTGGAMASLPVSAHEDSRPNRAAM